MSVNASTIFEAFIHRLGEHPRARKVWNKHWLTSEWTEVATTALADAVHDAMSAAGVAEPYVASKFKQHGTSRREFLTIDVTGFTWDWKVPAVVIEHENTNWKIEYCAWKVLTVDCPTRIVVAYVSSDQNWQRYRKDYASLEGDLQKVLDDQPGKQLDVFVGNWDAGVVPEGGWGRVFEHKVMEPSS